MPIETLCLGVPFTLVANRVYALPTRTCRIQSNAVVTASIDGTTFVALTGAETVGADTSAEFIKAATAAVVVCKAA